MPISYQKAHKEFPTKPQRPLDLANLVPLPPNSIRHNPPEAITEWTTKLLPGQYGTIGNTDDEHRLIARYCAKLAGRSAYPSTSNVNNLLSGALDSNAVSAANALQENFEERAMIAQLEEENNQMLREMASLEEQQGLATSNGQINGIRERRTELEAKMRIMQQTRRELMTQLEQLMQQLNVSFIIRSFESSLILLFQSNANTRAVSLGHLPEPLSGVGNMVSTAFREPSVIPIPTASGMRATSVPAIQLQSDLLTAADAIANNMGSLVLELDQALSDDGFIEQDQY